MTRLFIAWAGLVVAVLASPALSFLPIGSAHMVVALAIAIAVAGVLTLVCMRLLRAPPLALLLAIGGIAWFIVWLALGSTDYQTRPGASLEDQSAKPQAGP